MNLWKLPEIVIAPDVLFGGWVTNTLIGTWLAIIILVALLYFGIRRRAMIPSGLQNAMEYLVEFMLNTVESVSGK
ncbi:MAG TPA: hypothetical protein VKX46_04720, partial [Ktedonobacteraceae bacterium]|nr:hypothetical protein [Ktedonobacteraceae bacterium]